MVLAFRTRVAATVALLAATAVLPARADPPFVYPAAPRGGVADTYFGTVVADPYRWLENIDSAETTAWVGAEATLTESYLATLPTRDAMRRRLTSLWNYQRVSVPTHRGETYVQSKNSGLQSQAVVYVSHGENGPQHVLLDPNAFSNDGTVALGPTELSHDGSRFAYATQTSGSDWLTWHVRDVATGVDTADTIAWAKFSGAAWSADDRGFYYSAFDPPTDGAKLNIVNANQKVYFHVLGTPQTKDALIYSRPDHPEWFLGAQETDDGRYTIVTASSGSTNALYLRDRTRPGSAFTELYPNGVAQYSVVDNDGPTLYVQTNAGAVRSKLVAVDPHAPTAMRDVIPEATDTLESVTRAGGTFFATYLHDAHSLVDTFDRTGRAKGTLALPGIGTVSGFDGTKDDAATYYAFAGYTSPTTIYRYDIASKTSTLFAKPAIAFDPTRFVTEQVFVTSKDGTRLPMFVSYKRGLVRNGRAPTILYGYGGFDINLTPGFSPATAAWLDMGGVYAVPTLRGGGEYGEAWHLAGQLDRKQNVFDDFFAAAEYLIDRKYTSTPKLAVSGASNGGLLCGAAVTQRPALMAAALCDVGVMDMLRFQKFTVGSAWIPEYGSSEASAAQFATLDAYSPLERLKAGTRYPATLISTADHDDRVFPAHSFKFAATMQHDQAGPAPVLLFVERKAGHGAGKPTQKIVDEYGDKFAFLAHVLDFVPDPPGN